MTRDPAITIVRHARAPVVDRDIRRAVGVVLRETRRSGAVAVAFVGPSAMRRLNRTYHGEDHATDVLAFPENGGPEERHRGSGARFSVHRVPSALGDIIICPSVVYRNARRAGESERRETLRVLIHGTLHLLGYDHTKPRDVERMFAAQERILRLFS